MNPQRRRRIWLVIALVLAGGLATTLVAMAPAQRGLSVHTVGSAARRRRRTHALPARRHGGKGSFQRASGSLEAQFRVTDGDARLPVRYGRILPDLFREGQAVVATGRMQNGVFVAEDVLAKHDETYMPKEVADKMGSAHRKHAVPAAADQAGALR